jgi:mannose/fructose-specific phosphotransferase system component IIA
VSTPVGIAIVAHGGTATHLLEAARAIAPVGTLDDIVAVDAGEGQTPRLEQIMCDAIAQADKGRGVLVIVDLLGASPCRCAERQSSGHAVALLGGLNLAMLLKLAAVDRTRLDAHAIALACADSGRRSIDLRDADDAREAR